MKASKREENYRYDYYQFQAYNKSISEVKLNIVVLKTIRLQDGSPRDTKASINVFFSDDLSLDYQTMTHYYSLRFQTVRRAIEFDFRDAKQHFGLSNFKNYKEKNLTNFVNLSLLMCLVSSILLEEYRTKLAMVQLSVLDLKILFSARNSLKKLFKLTQAEPNTIINEHFCDNVIPDDLINAA